MLNRIVCGSVLFVVLLIVNFIYRPYVYSHQLVDYYIADTINNFFAVLIAYIILPVLIKHKFSEFSLVLQITIGFICYEIIQYLIGFGTFDIKDIFSSCLAGLLLSLFIIVRKKVLKYSGG